MIEAWETLANNPKLRVKPANLESISKWIKDGSPVDEIATTLSNSNSKSKLISEIDGAGGYRDWKVAKSSGSIIRGVTKKAFKSTFEAIEEISEQAWKLWKKQDWKKLEELFVKNDINKWDGIVYPPNDGFISYKIESLKKGKIIDRYGGYIDKTSGELKDAGKFFANNGEPIQNRALPVGSEKKIYSKYEILKDIPSVKQGEAIPWFGEIGRGIQYQSERSVDWLLKKGYLKRISTTAPIK